MRWERFHFLDEYGTFKLTAPENYSGLYAPVASGLGLKGSVTPNFGGDSKQGQNSFLMEPVSVENLNQNRGVRNFWCCFEDGSIWSAVGASAAQEADRFSSRQEESELTAGFMWQTVTRTAKTCGVKSEVTMFAPVDHNVEIMTVTIENVTEQAISMMGVAAVPIYGRSADNIRDHRHVTSLLHRITTRPYGVSVKPTLSFDERGHRKNERTYFVLGVGGDGQKPVQFYPVLDDFMGEGGTLIHPRTLLENKAGIPAGERIEGKEALGGIRFDKVSIAPGEKVSYTLFMGIIGDEKLGYDGDVEKDLAALIEAYDSADKVKASKAHMDEYWKEQVNVAYHTSDEKFDGFMKWVSFQPILRRIYGCSFLPHHDYGRGGRGWRDLWQDCLSLLLMDPKNVRSMNCRRAILLKKEQLLNSYQEGYLEAVLFMRKPDYFMSYVLHRR